MSTPYLGIAHIAAAQNQPEVTANTAFDDLDIALNAEASFALTDASTALTLTGAQMATGFVLKLTGTLTAARNVIVPATQRTFVVYNASSGGYAVTVKTSGGTGIAVPNASYSILYCDGTNVVQLTAGAAGANFADDETPSGSINGSNTAFTLAHSPNPGASLQLFLNGVLQQPGGADYTLSGASITMTSAPATGDILLAWYRY